MKLSSPCRRCCGTVTFVAMLLPAKRAQVAIIFSVTSAGKSHGEKCRMFRHIHCPGV